MGRKVVEFFASRTDVDITLGVVLERLRAKERGAVVVVGRGNVGMNVLVFESDNVLFRAVLAVAGSLPGPQFPAEARPPEQVEHGFVFGDFGGSHQHPQDDAGLAAIDDILRLVAQM